MVHRRAVAGMLGLTAAAWGQSAPDTNAPADDVTWAAWDAASPPQPLWQLRFEPQVWYAAPAGDVKLPGSPEAGGTTDLADLGLDSPRLSPAGALSLRRGAWRLNLAGSSTGVESTSTMASSGQIGDLVFGIGDQLSSTFRLTTLEATVGYHLFEARRGGWGAGASRLVFGVDAFAGLRVYEFDLAVSGPTGSSAVDEWFAEPILGAAAEVDLWKDASVELRVDVGAAGGYDDKTVESGAIQVGFSWRPWENVGAAVGYRLEAMGLSHGDGDEQLEFNGSNAGLLFGVSLRF